MATLEMPEKLMFLLDRQSRYKVAYGGRGSSKSWSFGRALIILAVSRKVRILCARQVQASIKDSVYKLLCDTIDALGLTSLFHITRDSIRCCNGSEFFFKGIQNNVNEIKSMEGIDYCWVEEAQNVSQESWDILIPTIRKEGSEIWITFNPDREEDATYRMFVTNPPDDCISVQINYDQNPWFPDTLRREMEYCKRVDYGKYEHVWLGKTVINTEAQVYNGKFEMKDFETPDGIELYYGADWGFACLGGDTLISTINGDVPIKNIKVGDLVLTREGYKKVVFTKNKGKRDVFDVDFGYKNSIITTSDHRIFTTNGWKMISELEEVETLCVKKPNLMGEFINVIQKASTQIISIVNGKKMASIFKKFYTEIFGSSIMDKYLMGAMFTILMGILSTTKSAISFALQKVNIKKYTTKINSGVCPKRLQVEMDIQEKIGLRGGKKLLKTFKKSIDFVKSVAKSLLPQMSIKNFVVQGAENTRILVKAKKNTFARRVVKSLWHHLIPSERLVLRSVHINSRQRKEQEEVFDITVEGGEFFANGVLVHNCDPTALVRCFIKDRCLWIDYESGGVGVDFEEIPALFDIVPDARKWEIRADCARPETISYVKRQGFRISACPKWKGSVEDGIAYIRGFERIYIHPRCQKTYNEFKFYSYKQDRVSGDVLPIVLDKDNHFLDALRYALNPYIQKNVSILDVL